MSGHTCPNLHHVANIGCYRCVKKLKDLGANIDELDHLGWTPLHVAAWQNNIECVEELLKHGADKSICSFCGTKVTDLASPSTKKFIDTYNPLRTTFVLRSPNVPNELPKNMQFNSLIPLNSSVTNRKSKK